jgi:hypothetical protein
MEAGAASDLPQWHVAETGSMSAGATYPALASSRSPLQITGAKRCLPGTFAKGSMATFGWTA